MRRTILGRLAARFRRAEHGATAIVFAIALPAVLGAFGGAADYAALSSTKGRATAATESAALAIGREMTLGTLSQARVQELAGAYVSANLGPEAAQLRSVSGQVLASGQQVRVGVTLGTSLPIGILSNVAGVDSVSASATVRVGQQSKLCLLAISEVKDRSGAVTKLTNPTGINLMTGSRLTANNCLVHSNVMTDRSVIFGPSSSFSGDVICARGNVQKMGATVNADVITNCPALANPLEARLFPAGIALCTRIGDVTLSSGNHVLTPGSYCGNVRITGTAQVRLSPGIYVLRGTLIVDKNASFTGANVGLFFSGLNSYFRFLDNSYIDITAPVSGEMAGMLIWEGVDMALLDSKSKTANYHQINSNRAKRLTGTIYLPAGRLLVDAKDQVADASEFTVMVVNTLELGSGPNLVLNSNYAGTTVPVPSGLGPLGAKNVRLEASQ